LSSAGDKILFHLKTHGAAGAEALAEALGVTPQAVRQQLDRLQDEALVAFEDQVVGRGRPKRHWRLSDTGHARFPDTHGQLAVELIRAIRHELGAPALDRIIAHRERDQLATYQARLTGCPTLADRVAALAELRTAEGYMAEWRETEDGFLLVENHCPICAAATECLGFCAAELDLFKTALGPGVSVERIDHIAAGGRRCAYRIDVEAVSRPA
jgi:predicted ArsR family transcriptional regulator